MSSRSGGAPRIHAGDLQDLPAFGGEGKIRWPLHKDLGIEVSLRAADIVAAFPQSYGTEC